ncbi:phage/plasmid primase, P4 family [Roseiconus lacunae]|uniref:phage/plasmid primase, P4 family n=1 Tax=Roseiconus lacunae TaxID=2605694 RepID=UPI00308FAAD9|nr:phage/plasmid primase, P4 family [Stieleria sp. HD01]
MKDDDIVGVDLDDCIDSDGQLSDTARLIIDRFNTYAEYSPSGNGVKLFCRGTKPRGKCKREGFECYDRNRFFTVTGKMVKGCPSKLSECDEALRWFQQTFLEDDKHDNDHGLPEFLDDTTEANIAKVREALPYVHRKHADDYVMWITIGQACFNAGGNELRADWMGWSESSQKFDLEECEAKWDSFVEDGGRSEDEQLGTGTVVHYAKQNGFKPSWCKPGAWLASAQGRNQNALATMFIDRYGADLRYVPAWKKWIVWDRKRFVIDEGGTRVTGLVRKFTKGLWQDFGAYAKRVAGDDGKAKTASHFVSSANSKSSIAAIGDLAKSDPRVLVDADQLDADPMLLNVQNGTLDLRSGEFREHSREDLMTQVASVSFDRLAKCPQWEDTCRMVFDEDDELIAYVQSVLGYSLSGDTGEHILPIAWGSGFNGKSTIWNAVLELAGDYGFLANESLLLGERSMHPTDKASLFQKRIVAISEPDKGCKLRESRVKELTGDDLITARRMNEDFWTFRRTHTFWLSSNHLPTISGTDDGIWRRIKLIPFAVNIRDRVDPVPGFHKRLVDSEGPGILNWLLAGFQNYRQNGFIEPAAVRDSCSAYRQDEDELARFIAECCDAADGLVVTATRLFDEYRRWGGKLNRTNFGREMGSRFDKEKPTSGEFRRKTIYRGLALSDAVQSRVSSEL